MVEFKFDIGSTCSMNIENPTELPLGFGTEKIETIGERRKG
jgi:hypothetical protein